MEVITDAQVVPDTYGQFVYVALFRRSYREGWMVSGQMYHCEEQARRNMGQMLAVDVVIARVPSTALLSIKVET